MLERAAPGTALGGSIRSWTAGLIAVATFIVAPYEVVPPGPPRLVVPVAFGLGLWLALGMLWRHWDPDRDDEVGFGRGVAGLFAGLLFAAAYLASQDTAHLECTRWIQTRDGRECVGEDVPAPGPDTSMVVFLAGAGAFAFWVAVARSPWAPGDK